MTKQPLKTIGRILGDLEHTATTMCPADIARQARRLRRLIGEVAGEDVPMPPPELATDSKGQWI